MRVSEIAHILKVRIVTNVLLGHMDQLDANFMGYYELPGENNVYGAVLINSFWVASPCVRDTTYYHIAR
jgi:hypothetical protein